VSIHLVSKLILACLRQAASWATAVEINSTESQQQKDPQKRSTGSGTQASASLRSERLGPETQKCTALPERNHSWRRPAFNTGHAALLGKDKLLHTHGSMTAYTDSTALLSKCLDSKGIGSKWFLPFSSLFLRACWPHSHPAQAYGEQR